METKKVQITKNQIEERTATLEGQTVAPVFLKRIHKDDYVQGYITGQRNQKTRHGGTELQVRVTFKDGNFAWYDLRYVYVDDQRESEASSDIECLNTRKK